MGSRCSFANAVSFELIPASVWSAGWRSDGVTSTRGRCCVFGRSRTFLHSFAELGDEAVRKCVFFLLDRFVPELCKRMQTRSAASRGHDCSCWSRSAFWGAARSAEHWREWSWMRRRWRYCCEGVVSDEVARGAFRPAVREGLLYGISTTGRSCPGVGSEFVIFERTDVLFVALWCCFRFGCVRFCRLGWTLVSFYCSKMLPLGQLTSGLRKLIRQDAVMVLSPDMVATLLCHGTYTQKMQSLARVRGCS